MELGLSVLETEVRYVPRHARRRRLLGPRGAGVVAAALLATSGTPGEASARSRVPAEPRGLPAGIEPFAPYEPQRVCYPALQPGVLAFRDLILHTYPRTASDGILRACSEGAGSEHKDGRAWDWLVRAHVPAERQQAAALLHWLLKADSAGYSAANARRLGIMYVIWNGRIWKSYEAARGWQRYTGPDAHAGHVHFSFSWAGAERRTSFYSKRVAAPVVAPALPMLGAGSAGPAVRDLQRILRVKQATGHFGTKTKKAVTSFQRAHHLPANGLLTRQTWAALLPPTTPIPKPVPVRARKVGTPVLRPGAQGPAVRQLQKLLNTRQDGAFGPATLTALRRFQARTRLTADGVAGARTWRALTRAYTRAHLRPAPTRKAASVKKPSVKKPSMTTPIRVGSQGSMVRDLQRRLRVDADGVFGPRTDAAVRAYQKRHHLVVDGVVGKQTMKAVYKT
ncbi:MAG: hypothetical protein JWM93_89 [Frankiales bacterium]|nr:hypothetical protein [Frankiales bacterium]